MYDYQCTMCGVEMPFPPFRHIGERLDAPCPLCGGILKRCVSAVNFGAVMQEHFNAAVGRPISSMRQFRSELDRKSDEQSAVTGVDHRFVPVDLNDKKALGVTDEGLDVTAKVKRDSGQTTATRKIIV